MAKKAATKSVTLAQIEGVIHIVRGQRVMLDSDLAELYGIQTKVLNQAVARNAERFPEDFAFQLTEQEFATWRPSKTALGLHRTRRRHALQRAAVSDGGQGEH